MNEDIKEETASIFYFSGTGNSFYIAKRISERLDGELIPITSYLKRDKTNLNQETTNLNQEITNLNQETIKSKSKTEEIESKADIIGIVYPVHCLRAPRKIVEFVSRLKRKKESYLFILVSCSSIEGNALQDIDEIIGADIGFIIFMPDNFSRNKKDKQNIESIMNASEEAIEEAVKFIKKRKKIKIPRRAGFFDFLGYVTMNYIRLNGRFKTVNKRCNLCRKCIDNCTLKNIKERDKKIRFEKDCSLCFSCINSCPEKAISFGLLKIKDSYKHPEYTNKKT
jgi:ferredoxin